MVDDDAKKAMAEAILDDSDRRQANRDAAPGTYVGHCTSEEATPPPGEGRTENRSV